MVSHEIDCLIDRGVDLRLRKMRRTGCRLIGSRNQLAEHLLTLRTFEGGLIRRPLDIRM